MRKEHHKLPLSATVLRLAATYLAIIMLMSIGFSLVFYATSSQELSRQLPPPYQSHPSFVGSVLFSQAAAQYLLQRINESRALLQQRLILINIGALFVGGILSYLLARRTLRPIEEAMDRQTQFVSDASHELRTPLTAIQTSNEVALRNPKLTLHEAKELIKQDTQDIKRLRDLSEGLLNLASQSQGSTTSEHISLRDITSDAMTQIAHQAIQKDIVFDDKMENLTVVGDRRALVQLLVILLDNAVKYNHKKGRVSLITQKKGKYALIAVKDEGIGIAAHDLPHVFQRFYRADNARTHQNRGSYGLGLPIAERIAANHHGSIQVVSEPGKGSTFTIKLPMP